MTNVPLITQIMLVWHNYNLFELGSSHGNRPLNLPKNSCPVNADKTLCGCCLALTAPQLWLWNNAVFLSILATLTVTSLRIFFCSQRGIRGGNKTNPSMYKYLYNINSIVLAQPSISTKSNAGSKGSAAAPYKYSVAGSLQSSQARKRKLDYFSQSN